MRDHFDYDDSHDEAFMQYEAKRQELIQQIAQRLAKINPLVRRDTIVDDSPPPGVPWAAYRIFRRRAVSLLTELHAICPRRGCRRAQCCCGDNVECLVEHRALAIRRLNAIIGGDANAATGDGAKD